MSRLFANIKEAVRDDRYFITEHADERLELRGLTPWQIAAGLDDAKLLENRPHTLPFPSIVVEQILPDGTTVEAVWSWSVKSRKARLVTVYFRE